MVNLLYSEISIFTIIILIIIALNASVFGHDKTLKNRMFVVSAWFIAAACLFDFFRKMSVTSYWSFPLPVIWAFNIMYFMCFGVSALFWFLYSEIVQKNIIPENKKKLTLSVLPLAILFVLLICSTRTGWLFYFDENKLYHVGPFSFFKQIILYGYIVVTSLKALILLSNKNYYAYRNELISIVSFAVPPLICATLQVILRSLPIFSIGIVISFLLAYINSLKALVSLDPLTGINNRRELLIHLSSKTEQLKQGERLYFLFLDVDSFKQINDTYGHSEGDHILKIIASVLKNICLKTNGFCSRYGGDEFAIVQVLEDSKDISLLCKKISEAIEKKMSEEGITYTVEISVGCAEYIGGNETMQSLILRADNAMYTEKSKKRQRV